MIQLTFVAYCYVNFTSKMQKLQLKMLELKQDKDIFKTIFDTSSHMQSLYDISQTHLLAE